MYDPSVNQWTMMKALCVPRRGIGIAVIGGAIYAAGGHDGKDYLDSVEKFHKYNQEWSVVGHIEDKRGRFGFA